MAAMTDNSLEQLAKLRARLADVKGEIERREKEENHWQDDSYVTISEDSMTASLFIAKPKSELDKVTLWDVVKFLRANDVTYGLDQALISQMIADEVYEIELEVAHGKPMVEGVDGYYDYNFSPDSHTSPKVLPDGSVDYTSMHMLQNVKEGDILATYHHAIPGKEGKDVRGKVLRPAGIKELKPLKGLNVSNEEDPDVYVSLIDGKVEYKDGRVNIQSTHEIDGDVDYLMGKIEFYGDIVINGNVEGNITLRAGRNIVISGTVGEALMFAGGDIIIARGIQGNQKSKISARGNIFSDFIEHCTVEAGGNVEAGSIVDSVVNASGTVTAKGKKGRIIGGYTHGTAGVFAEELGNMSESKTVVHAGYEQKTYDEVARLTAEESALADELQKVVSDMADILRARSNKDAKSKSMENRLPELDARKNDIFKQLDGIRSDIEFFTAILEKGKGSKVEIRGPVHIGSEIGVEISTMKVDRDTSFVRYVREGGRVQGTIIAL